MRPSTLRMVAAAAVAVLTCVTLYFAVYRRAVSNVGLRRAASRANSQTPDYDRPLAAREALAILAAIPNGSSDDQHIAMLRGANQLALGRSEEAEVSFKEALSWGKRPEVYVALASAQSANHRRDAAIESLLAAASFDPYSLVGNEHADLTAEVLRKLEARSSRPFIAEAYLSMAIAYFENGFPKEGVAMAAQAALFDPSVLRRRELAAWGMSEHAAKRYVELKKKGSNLAPP